MLSLRKIYQLLKIKFIYSACLDAMNTSYCRSIKRYPYEVVFGMKPNGVPRFLGEMQVYIHEEVLENAFHKELRGNNVHSSDVGEATLEPEATENQNGDCNHVFNSHLKVDQKSSYVDFPHHKYINHESQEKPYTVSSPRRQKIQKEVAETLKRTRKDMTMKYVTGKRVKVAEEGEHVSVKIPKAIRHPTDLRRLTCVILKRSPGRNPTYKLICEYGVIKRLFTAASLMPFPGDVKIGPPTNVLSLTDANKLFQMTEVTFCHLLHCNTAQCRCYRKIRQCSSGCHKIDTVNCKNKSQEANGFEDDELTANTLSVSSVMPAYGGEIELSDGNFVKLLDNCTIDTWIVILKAVMKNNPLVFLQQDQLSENLHFVIEKMFCQ